MIGTESINRILYYQLHSIFIYYLERYPLPLPYGHTHAPRVDPFTVTMRMKFSVPKFNEMNELCVKNTNYMHKLREKQSPGQFFSLFYLYLRMYHFKKFNFGANQTVGCSVLVFAVSRTFR